MLRLGFANSALLLGIATLAIPVVVHLFLRRQRLRLRFSTLQFFIKHHEHDKNWRRLMNWLLLATRLVLLSLLVLAFARPYRLHSAASGGSRTARRIVFVLDRTASMQASDGGVTRWSRAKTFATDTLNGLGFQDRVALVDGAGAVPLSSFVPPQQLHKQLDQLECGFGGGDIGDGLQQAVKLLSMQDHQGRATIFVVSDLQRQSCQKLDLTPIPQNIELKIFAVGETNTPNLAISDLALPTEKTSLSATIINFSNQDAKVGALEWEVDGRVIASPSITLPARTTTNVSALLPALKPGWHQVAARLQSHDRFAVDDTRHLVIHAPEPLNVLCVETRHVKHVFEEESFFLVSALQPEGTNSVLSSFHVDKLSPEAIATTALTRYQLILLPVLREVPEGLGKVLTEFAQRGGSVLFFAGDNLNPSSYNAALAGLLPASLGRVEGELPAFEKCWRLADCDSNSTVFAAFRQPGSGDLTVPEFWRRCALNPAEGAQVLARFGDKSPFLISKQIGRGRVALVNTSANTAWSDWPKHKTFVPWLHGLCYYLAGNELSLGVQIEKPAIVGTTAEVDVGSDRARQPLRINSPAGAPLSAKTDEQGKLQLSLAQPGFYSVLDSEGQMLRMLAVNPPQRESDLAALTAAEFQQQLVRGQAATQTELAAINSTDGHQSIWRLLMFAGAIILLLEIILANRTYA